MSTPYLWATDPLYAAELQQAEHAFAAYMNAQASRHGQRQTVERISPAEIALMRATAIDAEPIGRNRYEVR